jgi:type IV pilus assembly protein PilB
MALTKDQLHAALVDTGGVTEEQFQEAAGRKEAAQIGVDGVLVARGELKDEQLGQLLALSFNVPFVNLQAQPVEKNVVNLLPEAYARTHDLLPVRESQSEVMIATTQPDDIVSRATLEKYLRRHVTFAYATPRDIKAHMFLFQADPREAFKAIADRPMVGEAGTDTRTVELVDAIINYAYQAGASDVHIEPEEDYSLVRFRQDGILHDVAELPVKIHENIMTRLKVLSRLATDEHRAAQDGKITHKTPWGDEVEIRLSLIPTTHAEKAVMRLLSDQSHAYALSDLGFAPDDYQKVSDVIHKPWGSILVTGPTGSGKTTTLYAILRILNQRDVNITTIEDPVEFDIENVNQIQVNEKTGLTFASGLRSIVRQDPDIIMVGEIRDSETAAIAVNAAMTGHLVLSTLHTNDASTAFPRLQDMGVEDFLIASTVNVIVAQRLVRKICMSCIQSVDMEALQEEMIERVPHVKEHVLELMGGGKKKTLKNLRTFSGKGCHVCHGSGFKGRIGVFEVLSATDAIREAIMARKNADEIRELAIKEGMTSMLYDGLRKVLSGQTTIEEVLRVTRE